MAEIVVFVRSRPFFGAQLVMFPALYQLKQWWPERRLRVVARDPLGPIFRALPWVDEFVMAKGLREEYAALGSACRTFVGLHPSSELHGVLGMLRRPAQRLGLRNRRLCDWIWTHSVRHDTSGYRALSFLQLLHTLQPFDVLQSACNSVAALAAAHREAGPQTHASGCTVTIMPGAGAGEFKKWGIGRYIELADRLARDGVTRFNFILGPAEAAETEMLRALGRPGFHLLEAPSLPSLAAAVMASSLVVANDCGPSHLAQCAGRPFVGLFDAAKPEWFWSRPGARCLLPPAGQPLSALAVAEVYEACRGALVTGS